MLEHLSPKLKANKTTHYNNNTQCNKLENVNFSQITETNKIKCQKKLVEQFNIELMKYS